MKIGIGTLIASRPAGSHAHAIDVAREEASSRPNARGKFLYQGGKKLYVRGVTYGTFRPLPDGHEYPEPGVVARDFALMASSGANALRTYTVPPRWLLDLAAEHGLGVLVGLAVERVVGYLADGRGGPDIDRIVRQGVAACAGHPALLAYAIGNEIPSQIVRWHGRRRTERFLERLYRTVKSEDPLGLVTYANYPTTEYLDLPFLDLVCFNTYLESRQKLDAYLARLQNIAADRPLILGELGLDSVRNGEQAQATSVEGQVRSAFAAGCAGLFVYSWTDEWYRGGAEVSDWGFGMTRRDRSPKPALASVGRAFADVPFPRNMTWPRVSVVVCSYNGARTLRACLEGIRRIDYPNFEVIVVDDGSTDSTPQIAAECGVRVISTENRGLSCARNTGMEAASGEIVAYLDDDAYPDPHWLTYLAVAFLETPHAAVGGPNIGPLDAGAVAQCVAKVPGNPTHVLLSDREAEHLPGCNLAVRREILQAVGGFDPAFRIAGDDVDLCWRLREKGWTLGFAPGAMVWHHRRGSVGGFWRQQRGYGRAEALLERKWPAKYNALGHMRWRGRIYSNGIAHLLARPSRVYYGTWGTAPFQSLCRPAPGRMAAFPALPEWYLLVFALAAFCVAGAFWNRLLLGLPLLAGAVLLPALHAVAAARRATFAPHVARVAPSRAGLRALTAFLYLLQPAARLHGRLAEGLTPWRRLGAPPRAFPRSRRLQLWTERWCESRARLSVLKQELRSSGVPVRSGSAFDRFDLETLGGLLGRVRLLMAVEEHGQGRQLVRVRARPNLSKSALGLSLALAALAAAAGAEGAWLACSILGGVAILPVLRTLDECALAMGAVLRALERTDFGNPP